VEVFDRCSGISPSPRLVLPAPLSMVAMKWKRQ
jgi:hypothetical protein